jgi:light-regulated signal transduction histidine kinase (bacteriophytochrome)
MTLHAPAADASTADISKCDREPIHIPGRIQPHGVLLALDPNNWTILQASESLEKIAGVSAQSVLGQALSRVLSDEQVSTLRERCCEGIVGTDPLYLMTIEFPRTERRMHVLAHQFKDALIFEFEPAQSADEMAFQGLHGRVRAGVARLQQVKSIDKLCQIAAEEVQRVTGFGRVMLYKFDEDWNGVVVGEARTPDMEPYLHHHFPASDIPRQARELYRVNRLRLIANVDYRPAEIMPTDNPITGRPLDLSYSALRSVSPVHLEYLKNMNVGASMSISIVKDEKLWGLIACHHRTPRFVPYDIRTACDYLGQVVSLQLSATEYSQESEHRLSLRETQTRLLERMAAHGEYMDGLLDSPDELLSLAKASGVAVLSEDRLHLFGDTPTESQVIALADWLSGQAEQDRIFATDSLAAHYSAAEAYRDKACGLLAISVQRYRRNYVMWFRPELVQTLTWAGDPHKRAQELPEDVRIHPRKSFEAWKQVVHLKSEPWREFEIEAVSQLRDAIVSIVLRRADELARLNAELERSNKELEAFSYSVSHDLRAPFRHIVGFSDLLQKRAQNRLDETDRRYISVIADAARTAGSLVDSLLLFSQMGRASLRIVPLDMNKLVEEIRVDLMSDIGQRQIEWTIERLPPVMGDTTMLRLAVRNLLSNAVKYTRDAKPAKITITSSKNDTGEFVFAIKDNGVGFDMNYVDKLFGVFQRLHRIEEFEGTGIGLANVKRIIERHGGRVWAEGAPGQGASFYFTLPPVSGEEVA